MATETERLIVALEARTAQFEKALQRANKVANDRVKAIETRFNQANKNVSASFDGIGASAARAFAVAGSLRGAQQLLDASTRINNSLKISGLSGEALNKVYDKLYASAQKNAAPLETLVELYSRASLVQGELGATTDDLIKFTDKVAVALRVSGKSAAESSGALLQLSQLLGSGTVRAEEFNSVQEGALPILKAVATGLKEAGGSVAELRKIVIAGKLSSKEFFDAFDRGSVILDKMASGSSFTIDQGFTRLQNTLIDVAKRMDAVTGVSGKAGDALARMASIVETLAVAFEAFAGGPAGKFVAFLDDVIQRFEPIQAGLQILANEDFRSQLSGGLDTLNGNGDPVAGTRKQIADMFAEYRKGLAVLDPDKLKPFDELAEKIANGAIGARDAKAAIDAIVGDNSRLTAMANAFQPLIDKLGEVVGAAREAGAAMDSAFAPGGSSTPIFEGNRASGFGFKSASDATQKAIDKRNADARRGDLEKEIDTRAKAIVQEFGDKITEAAAKVQAAKEIEMERAASSRSSSTSTAAGVIRDYEQFRAKPYWDVNAYRAGFGSDTVTLSDGSIQKVTQGITVSLADANRDLARRIDEFQDGIKKSIGADTFASFDANQQAALTSIAYNYGSLPQRIVDAVKTGSQASIVQAIRGLGGDNNGINRSRRNSEADLFLGGAPSGVRREVQGQSRVSDSLKDIEARIALINQETAAQAGLNPLVNDYGFAVEKARVVQELLNEAQQNGIAITPELRAKIEELATQYATASVAGDRLAESQGKLQDRLAQSSAFGKDVLGGFIRDLRDGKSATEALANALDKVADKLLDMALNSLFDGAGGKAGGGPLGGIFGSLFSLFGFAKGGIAAHGKPLKRFAGGGVSRSAAIFGEAGPEAAVPLPDGRRIPVELRGPGREYGGRAGGEVVNIVLTDDSGRMAEIAGREFETRGGTLVKIAVQQSVKSVNRNLPGMMANAQARAL